MKMESRFPVPPYRPHSFLFPLFIGSFFIKLSFLCHIPGLHSLYSFHHWQRQWHSEIFPASTSSAVFSKKKRKKKIPWSHSTWNNHFLSQTPRRELSVYCCIPKQHLETEAHWDSETAHKQSVESCFAPRLALAAHIDCKKMRTNQSWRKVRANKRGKYHWNIIHVKEDVGLGQDSLKPLGGFPFISINFG